VIESASGGSKRVVFRPVLRARHNIDGSANFLGPFAHGPRTERFIYLVWVAVHGKVAVKMVGRILRITPSRCHTGGTGLGNGSLVIGRLYCSPVVAPACT
jgi:hypothetical protein